MMKYLLNNTFKFIPLPLVTEAQMSSIESVVILKACRILYGRNSYEQFLTVNS
jgi:hypothetical protein